MQKTTLRFGGIAPFDMKITLAGDPGDEIIMNAQHVHDECEICFNLSGDVSFMVENMIYPIEPGSVIITRPHEAHHCIYHSTASHRHFWILFSASDNERYFDLFFDREKGTGNLILLSPENTVALEGVCRQLLDPELSSLEKYGLFFEMLRILHAGKRKNQMDAHIRPEILTAINTINADISRELSVRNLAKDANMSIRTFERHFSEGVGMTPSRYIKNRRLALSKSYLADGFSVIETSEKCGFSDCSHFIAEFKNFYGITPLKYRRQIARTE